jgi:hypothetical protein
MATHDHGYFLNPEIVRKHLRTLEEHFIPQIIKILQGDTRQEFWVLKSREIVILVFFFVESILSSNTEMAQSLEIYQIFERLKNHVDIDSDSLLMIPINFPVTFNLLNTPNNS